MSDPLCAEDLWPLILKLPPAEQLRVAKLALVAATGDGASGYIGTPLHADEFSSDDGALAWEAEGWDVSNA